MTFVVQRRHAVANSDETPTDRRVELRKYPNRRYYDTSRSQYVTLEEILAAIRAGYEVHVTDSKSGEDITAKVLAQIIFEHDTPKLEIFPAALLHQLIRTNEPLIREFVDKYFCRALSAFLDSQRQFEQYLRQTLGLSSTMPAAQEWARWMMGPFVQPFFPSSPPPRELPPPEPAEKTTNGSPPDADDLRRQFEELKKQFESLRQQIEGQ
jgi:polyhydroxyalkanoate synthesis repressor PhaR